MGSRETYARWLERVAEADRAALEALTSDQGKLEEAFCRDLKFGTGGLRGKLGLGPNRLNVYTVAKATQGLADYLNGAAGAAGVTGAAGAAGAAEGAGPEPRLTVALARDSRHGGEEFVRAAAQVLAANGIKAVLYPRIEPTPALSFAVRDLGAAAGVCVTASHNPAEYNGYKVYGADGCQITVTAAKAIQAAIDAVDVFDGVRSLPFDEGADQGLICWMDEGVLDRYCAAVLEQSTHVDASGLTVAYTPLNGTGIECVRRVLDAAGVRDLHVVAEQAEPDGDFPTCPKPNPEVREALELGIALGSEVGADLLLATDPDADRVGVAVPHQGEWKLLTGNETGLLLLDFLAMRAREAGLDLGSKVVCTTVVSAPMADDLAREYGFELRRTLTGFKFTGEQIGLLEAQGRSDDFLFGLEESYGYLAGTYVRDKDAVVSCLLICELAAWLKERGLNLWEAMQALYGRHGFWGNEQVSVAYEGADGPERMAAAVQRLRDVVPAEVGGLAVERVIDYKDGAPMPVVGGRRGQGEGADAATVQVLPPSNVLELRLAGGSRVLLRPSGTEPKLKAYAFARAATRAAADELLASLVADMRGMLV